MKFLILVLIFSTLTACGMRSDSSRTNFAFTKSDNLKIDLDKCHLARPIELPNSPFEQSVQFKNVVVDQIIKQKNLVLPNQTNPNLILDLFPIYNGQDKTNLLGANIFRAPEYPAGRSVGFTKNYSYGGFISGNEVKGQAGLEVYETIESHSGVTDNAFRIGIRDNQIISVLLVYSVVIDTGLSSISTGEVQSLCITSMQLQ